MNKTFWKALFAIAMVALAVQFVSSLRWPASSH